MGAFHAALVPIPGFKTVAQVQENVSALQFGALPQATMLEIERIVQETTQPPETSRGAG
jgi:aryl-alcohol dehydrogenase-like predicted oxidoreductase